MSTAAIPAVIPPLQWSHWYPCGPDFDVSYVPEVAGLCVIGRREGGGFSIVHLESSCNVQQAFRSLFEFGSAVYPQLQQGQCLMRYVPIAQRAVRTQVFVDIKNWMERGVQESRPPLVRALLSAELFSE